MNYRKTKFLKILFRCGCRKNEILELLNNLENKLDIRFQMKLKKDFNL